MSHQKLPLLASVAVLAASSPALADAVDAHVEERIVTAQKREQKTLDVPTAITS